MAIDWPHTDASFVSLTYHDVWPEEREAFKGQLWRFLAAVEYRCGAMLGDMWRLEAQQRGAPHYHLLFVWQKGRRIPEQTFRNELTGLWQRIVGTEGDYSHWLHGVHVRDVEPHGGMARLLNYIVKEMSKVSQNADETPWGRLWGCRGDIPFVEGEQVELSEADWQAFCERVHSLARAEQSWYLRAITSDWPGFTLILDPSDVRGLLAGIPAGP